MGARPLAVRLSGEPPPAWQGAIATLFRVTAGILLVYPLKSIAPVVSLGVVFIPGVLLIATVWGWRLGLLTPSWFQKSRPTSLISRCISSFLGRGRNLRIGPRHGSGRARAAPLAPIGALSLGMSFWRCGVGFVALAACLAMPGVVVAANAAPTTITEFSAGLAPETENSVPNGREAGVRHVQARAPTGRQIRTGG